MDSKMAVNEKADTPIWRRTELNICFESHSFIRRIDMRNLGKVIFLTMCSLLLLLGCAYRASETENTVEGRTREASETESTFERWGSFTADKSYSYDEKYYAIQEVEYDDDIGVNYIKVCIYETETDEPVSFFIRQEPEIFGVSVGRMTLIISGRSPAISEYIVISMKKCNGRETNRPSARSI